MKSIQGLTFYQHAFMSGQETIYIGYDKQRLGLIMQVSKNLLDYDRLQDHLQINLSYNQQPFFTKLIDFLMNNIHMEKWSANYEDRSILDGAMWTITLVHDDNSKTRFNGMNAYPPKFDKLKQYLNQLWETLIKESTPFPFIPKAKPYK
jgi:hypothetical protein